MVTDSIIFIFTMIIKYVSWRNLVFSQILYFETEEASNTVNRI